MPRRRQSRSAQRKPLSPGSQVFAYLRDSGGAAQEKSVGDQRQALADFAAERGFVVLRWFTDEARPGSDAERRPAFQDMIAACRLEPAPVAAVLVWSLSRLGRDELDAQFYRADLRRRGVDVVSVNPSETVPDGPAGYLFEALVDWKNRTFLDDMSRDVRRGLRANVTAGFAPGGTPPTGYRAVKEQVGVKRDGRPRLAARWELDPAKAPLVRKAFELFAQGATYADIHRATGLLGKVTSYKSMLTNRSYLGMYKFGREEFPGLPAIVDAALWDAVQARMRERAHRFKGPDAEYLLSGLLECSYCGSLMSGGTDRRNEKRGYRPWRYYVCTNKRRVGHSACTHSRRMGAEVLERRIVNAVLDDVLTPSNVRQLLDELQQRLSGSDLDAEITAMDACIATTKRAVANLLDVIEIGDITRGDAADRLKSRQAELSALEAERAGLVLRKAQQARTFTEDDLALVLGAMREGVTAEEVPVARSALRALILRIEVRRDAIRITYSPDVFTGALHAQEAVPPREYTGCACKTLVVWDNLG